MHLQSILPELGSALKVPEDPTEDNPVSIESLGRKVANSILQSPRKHFVEYQDKQQHVLGVIALRREHVEQFHQFSLSRVGDEWQFFHFHLRWNVFSIGYLQNSPDGFPSPT